MTISDLNNQSKPKENNGCFQIFFFIKLALLSCPHLIEQELATGNYI